MTWRADDPQGNEAQKVRYDIVPFTRGRGVDLGCGPVKAYPHMVGVDSCKDTALFGIEIKPDLLVDDCSSLAGIDDGYCDFAFSSHLLEHIPDYRGALREWWRIIKEGGYLVLYLPHRDLYPNIGQPGANPDHKHDFVPEDILDALRFDETVCGDFGRQGFQVVVNEVRDQGMEYSFLLVLRKDRLAATRCRPLESIAPSQSKTVCVVRYGGFGDQIQAANILPELKRQGYHITFMTTPKGHDILAHDPHIDAWLLQDEDQVPNVELFEYWKVWQKKFDRFINLCESVEGSLLAMPGRANHGWPDKMRRQHLGHNYLEFTAEIAQLPYKSEARFFETPEEKAEVLRFLAKMRGGNVFKPAFTIMFALAGSSHHKFYPHQDTVLARIISELPDARVIMVGDTACKILEVGWEQHERVTCASGELSIRQTLALANYVNCVVGPETGVLNAVAFRETYKVLMLSHSSVNNLPLHWKNTAVMVPKTPCHPCHRLHYGREYCFEHKESGAAQCQFDIPPAEVFESIKHFYDIGRKAAA